MPISRTRHGRLMAGSAAVGALLVGMASVPAHSDSTREEQWHLNAMQAESIWRTSTGKGITVAVIDSGVDPNNADLRGRVLDGLDLAPEEAGDEHTDYDGHGTGMAGLIAATGAHGGGQGSFGLAPGAKILPIRLPDGAKANNQYDSAAEFNKLGPKAIRYAVDHGAKVINISLGVVTGSQQLTSAVDYALKHGSLIFSGTGNDGADTNRVEYPASTPGVVGVSAVGKDSHMTEESTHGSQVDMSAPGADMIHACGSASSKTGLCDSHGTSDASALASASAALIWSRHPGWTNNQVLRVMLNTIGGPSNGEKRNDFIGYGIVRPRVALKSPGDPGPADKYPLRDYPAAVTKPPSPQDSPATGALVPRNDDAAAGDDSSTTLWIGVAGGAVVLVGGGAVALLMRRRRRQAVQPPVAFSPGQQNQPGYPTYSTPSPYQDTQYGDSGGSGRPGA